MLLIKLVENNQIKWQGLHASQVAHQVKIYPGFCCM